jgi:putative transposase
MEVTKNKEQAAQRQEGKKPEINPAIIEELMKGYRRPEDLTGRQSPKMSIGTLSSG